jgi:hypothetical protein
MSIKKVYVSSIVVFSILVLALFSAPARADNIDVNFAGGGTYSWSGSGNTGTLSGTISSGTGITLTIARQGSSVMGPFSLTNATESWTSGACSSCSGTGPFTFSGGGSITISDTASQIINGVTIGPGSLFSGSFTDGQTLTNGAGASAIYAAPFVNGTASTALLQALGFSTTPTTLIGSLSANLNTTSPITAGTAQTSQASIASGDLTLTQTTTSAPEPGTLGMLCFGLLLLSALAFGRRSLA